MHFILDGKPLAKARPRLGKFCVFDKQHSQKQRDALLIKAQMRDKGYKRYSKQSLLLRLVAYTPIPKSWSTAKKNAYNGAYDVRKPDLDNVIKYYCDILNKLAYEDDAHIVALLCRKVLDDNPRVELFIAPIDERFPSGIGLC